MQERGNIVNVLTILVPFSFSLPLRPGEGLGMRLCEEKVLETQENKKSDNNVPNNKNLNVISGYKMTNIIYKFLLFNF